MGPRLFSRGKEHALAEQLLWDADLQWGPGYSAGERLSTPASIALSLDPSSMGPRLFSRGKDISYAGKGAGLGGVFNGAPAIQPGKGGPPRRAARPGGRLQWGPGYSAGERRKRRRHPAPALADFNGAPAIQPGKGVQTECRSGWPLRHFNGAPAIQPGKGWVGPGSENWSRRTSMGPRLFSRGKAWGGWPAGSTPADFNGAPAIQPGKGARLANLRSITPCVARFERSVSVGRFAGFAEHDGCGTSW